MKILLLVLAMFWSEIAFCRLADNKIHNLIYKHHLDIYELVRTSEKALLH
jgi:hypothetical protein